MGNTRPFFPLGRRRRLFYYCISPKATFVGRLSDDGNNAALCLGGRERASEYGASAEQTATTDHRPATVTGRLRVPRTEGNAITHSTAPPTTTTAATSSRSTTRSTTRRAVSTTTARTDGPTNPPTATDG